MHPTRSHATTKELCIRPQTKKIAQSPVAHDRLNKVTPVVEKGVALIYNMAAGWRVYLALVEKGLMYAIVSFALTPSSLHSHKTSSECTCGPVEESHTIFPCFYN